MKITPTVLAALIASSSFALAAPAQAQMGGYTPEASASASNKKDKNAPADDAGKPKISSSVRKEILELQTAVNAKDVANIPVKIAAAKAKAKTKDDIYTIAQLQLKAAVDANDKPGMLAGLQGVASSGFLKPADTVPLYLNIGKLNYEAKAYDPAGVAFEQVLRIDPNNVEATVLLAEARNSQGRTVEAISMIERAIAAKATAGQKADEAWYKRAVALSYNAKLATAPDLARNWVAAYPNAKNWRDTIRIYQTTSGLDDASLVDSMRLARLTGALSGENDYFKYTNALVSKGFPGEAKIVLDEAFAAKAIDRSRGTFTQLYSLANARAQGDRASLAASAATAKSAADARKAMTTAEAYYGYGDYAQAAELYRVALTKAGVDKDLANLRLGMALTGAGDKAGATAAFNAVGGAQGSIAKLWLTYLAQKA